MHICIHKTIQAIAYSEIDMSTEIVSTNKSNTLTTFARLLLALHLLMYYQTSDNIIIKIVVYIHSTYRCAKEKEQPKRPFIDTNT